MNYIKKAYIKNIQEIQNMKVKIPSPKSEFVKKAFVILVTGILPFSLIVMSKMRIHLNKRLLETIL